MDRDIDKHLQHLKADPDQQRTALRPLSPAPRPDPGPFPLGTLPLRPALAEEEEEERFSTMCIHTLCGKEKES